MSGLKRWGKVIALCGLLCMALASCDRSTKGTSSANKTLSAVKLPLLPEGVTDARCWAGGTFAKFVNIKFTASREQALQYLAASSTPYYLEFNSMDGKLQVSETHVLSAPPEVTENRVPVELALGTGMATQAWFKSVYEIRHGWCYSFQEDLVGYQFYYDLDSEQFYIYWYYS